jgi:hypothetical protein
MTVAIGVVQQKNMHYQMRKRCAIFNIFLRLPLTPKNIFSRKSWLRNHLLSCIILKYNKNILENFIILKYPSHTVLAARDAQNTKHYKKVDNFFYFIGILMGIFIGNDGLKLVMAEVPSKIESLLRNANVEPRMSFQMFVKSHFLDSIDATKRSAATDKSKL